MKGHLYKYTIEYLEDSKGNPIESDPLIFEAKNHDNIFRIIEGMKGKAGLDEEDVTAFAVRIKLFSEVLLKNKENELFQQFKPHFSSFMKELKKS